jgi:hypothetical protein
LFTSLLTITAIIELGAGVALMGIPSQAATLLLGVGLQAPNAGVVGRVAGTAIFSLGIACWLGRRNGKSAAGLGMTAGMTFYNIAVAALLGYAGIGLRMAGIGLWPAVALHAVMAVWCIVALRRKPPSSERAGIV